MKRFSIVLLTGLLILGARSQAQVYVGTPRAGVPSASPAAPEPAFNITFQGGRPKQLIAALEKAAEQSGTEKPNVIISPDLEDVSVPPFELHNVSTAEVFGGLNQIAMAADAGYLWQQSSQSPNKLWALVKHSYQPQGYGFPPASGSSEVPPAKVCRIFQVGQFLDKYTIEDITTAIRTAWDLLQINEKNKPEMRFHKETQLLIVVGFRGDLIVVENVLRELEKSFQKAQPKPEGTPKKKEAKPE